MTDVELIIVCLVIIAVGIGLFFLTGFIHVKRGWIAIIEKLGQYVGTYTKPFVYFAPLFYRRVGMYPLSPITKPLLIGKEKFTLTYQIIDAKTYHYAGHDLNLVANAELHGIEHPSLEQISQAIAKAGCKTIAVKGE